MAVSSDNEKLFTNHTSPKLTFIIGMVSGITIMTLGGIAFFSYALAGGQVGNFDIKPLEPSQSLLEEPVGEIELNNDTKLSVPNSDHIMGATENYKVTLVQYVDYECRFCKKSYPEIKEFVNDHKDTIRFIVKQYPLVQIHPQAKRAALAAECAADQHKLFEFSSLAYERQSDLNHDIYTQWASELALDMPTFGTCFEEQQHEATVTADIQEARHFQIKSQPNLLIWHNDNSFYLIDGYVNRNYLESILSDSL